MHLGGSLTQLVRRKQVGPDQAPPGLRDLLVDQRERRRLRAIHRSRIGGPGHHPFVEPSKGVQRVLPCVPLVRHESLEDGQRHRLLVVPPVLERSRHGGDVGEARLLREKGSDLEIRVLPLVDPPEQFEDEPVSVDHGRVALFRLDEGRRQVFRFRPAKAPEDPRAGGHDLAGAPLELPPVGDRLKEKVAHILLEEGVVDDPLHVPAAPAHRETGDDGMGELLLHLRRPFPGSEHEGHGVGLRIALGIFHLNQNENGRGRGAGKGDHLPDARGFGPPRLPAEPAARLQVVGQDLLQFASSVLAEQLVPAPRHLEGRNPSFLVAGVGLALGDLLALEGKPVERVGTERENIRLVLDDGELRLPEQLHGNPPLVGGEVQLHELGEAGQVGHDEDQLLLVAAEEREDLGVLRVEELDRAAAERLEPLPQREEPLHVPEGGAQVVLPRLHVDRLVVVIRIDVDGQVEPLGRGAGKTGVPVRAPLHGGADPVAVPDVDVVAHPDLVPVIENRRPGQGEEERVHQLELAPVLSQERHQAAADPEVDPRLGVVCVHPVHVVPLLVRDHLQRQFIVIPQEKGPLVPLGDLRRLRQDVDDRVPVLHPDGHEHPGHEGEVERHVALVAVSEIGDGVLRPLVRLGQEQPVAELLVDALPDRLERLVRLGEVLAVRSLPLDEIGDRVQPEPVHAHAEPELQHPEDDPPHIRIVVIEVRLVGVEPVPVVGVRHRVPRPVGGLEVLEDDPRLAVLVGRGAPDVEVAPPASRGGAPRPLEPGVLVGGVVDDELRDHPDPPPVRLAQEQPEVGERPVGGVDVVVIRDVVPVVLQGRGVEREEPERGDPEVLQVVQLRREPPEVPHPVPVAVVVGADVEFVDDRVLVPEGIVVQHIPSLFPIRHSRTLSPFLSRATGSSRNPARSGPSAGCGRCAPEPARGRAGGRRASRARCTSLR